MIVTHKIKMDLSRRGITEKIDAVQDDRYSRNLEFTLTQNGMPWTIPEGASALVCYKKPDGTSGNYDTLPDGSTAWSVSGNVLTVALAPQVCTVPGTVLLAVSLLLGEAAISTFSVNIVVQPIPGANMISEDYLKVHVIDRLEKILQDLEEHPPDKGADGRGIVSIQRTEGDGSPGTTDTYTITYTDGTADTFTVYNGIDSSGGKSAYQYAVDGGYTGTEAEFAQKLAEEMPTALPNPHPINFTGAVDVTYDGTESVNVEIPVSTSDGTTSSGMVREFDSGAISVDSYTYNGIDSKLYCITIQVTDQGDRVFYHTHSVAYRAIRYLGNRVLEFIVPCPECGSEAYVTLKATLVTSGTKSVTFAVSGYNGTSLSAAKIVYAEGFS